MIIPPEFKDFRPFGAAGFNAYIGEMFVDPAKAIGDPKRFGFLPEGKHLNGGGALHGGLLMTLADNVLGFTANEVGNASATVTLNTDFLAAGEAGAIVWGSATVTRRTRSLIFVSGDLMQNDRLLMTATGIWKVLGA